MNRLLLDTHTFLWWINNSYVHLLSRKAQSWLADDNHQLYLSMASIWEIAVKVSIGKLNLSQPLDTFRANQLETNNVTLLNITLPHAVRVATLPLHHRDPFDRLLVAQSLVEDLPLLSKDDMFDAYGVVRLW